MQKSGDILGLQDKTELDTPETDLHYWGVVFQLVKEDISKNPKLAHKWVDMDRSGQHEEAAKEFYDYFNHQMRRSNCVGAYEEKDGVPWLSIAKKLTSHNPEAKGPIVDEIGLEEESEDPAKFSELVYKNILKAAYTFEKICLHLMKK
jgi:hypothetical protein